MERGKREEEERERWLVMRETEKQRPFVINLTWKVVTHVINTIAGVPSWTVQREYWSFFPKMVTIKIKNI